MWDRFFRQRAHIGITRSGMRWYVRKKDFSHMGKNMGNPYLVCEKNMFMVSSRWLKWILIDFSLTVKAATLIFISGRGSAISSSKEGKSGFIHDLVNS